MLSLFRHIPNTLTVLRIVLVVPFVLALCNQQHLTALVLLSLAGLTDVLDGFLARKFQWYSWFGSVADPVADKTLMVTTYFTLGFLGHLPVWLVYTVIGRDVLIFLGSLMYWRVLGQFEGKPTILGKLCTFFLVAYALIVVASLTILPVSDEMLAAGGVIIAIFCGVSACQYVFIGFMDIRNKCR